MAQVQSLLAFTLQLGLIFMAPQTGTAYLKLLRKLLGDILVTEVTEYVLRFFILFTDYTSSTT